MARAPISLDPIFNSMSRFGGSLANADIDVSGALDTITRTIGNYGTGRYQSAMADEVRQRQAVTAAEQAARANLAQMIREIGMVNASAVPGELEAIGVDPSAATPDQSLGATRALAARNFTPGNIGNIVAEALLSPEDVGGATNLRGMLSILAATNRDADTVSGLSGSSLAPGHSVFESGALARDEDQQVHAVALNDADNATLTRNAEIAAAASRYGSDQQAAVARERAATDDRASQVALETSRANRIDQQAINSAVNGALGLRPNDTTTEVSPQLRSRVGARVAQMMRDNPNIDVTTAASAAVAEFVQEDRAGVGWFNGPERRRLRLTDEGASFDPVATAAAVPAAPTPTFPTDNADLPRPRSPAERDALPPNTRYLAPDGSVRITPPRQ